MAADVIHFELRSEMIHLVQLLKATGLCQTGGEAKVLVEEGEVRVDGEVESRRRRQIRAGMRVEALGEVIVVSGP